MADSDVQITAGSGTKIDTRTVGAGTDEHRQVIVLGDPVAAANVTTVSSTGAAWVALNLGGQLILGDTANGLDVDVTRLPADTVGSGGNAALKVRIENGAGASAEVSTLTADAQARTAAWVHANTLLFNGSNWDRMRGDTTNGLDVDVTRLPYDIAHGTADSGNPIKTGLRAQNAFPTAEANNDRVNAIGDLWGRQMVTHIDPAQQVTKSFNATTTQTGTDVWSPTSGKKIAVTSLVIGTYGTTAGRVILWFGDNADTTYTAGTDQLLLAFSTAPSSTSKPGLVFTPAVPIFCTTADRELHITTDAAISIDIAVHGYEW